MNVDTIDDHAAAEGPVLAALDAMEQRFGVGEHVGAGQFDALQLLGNVYSYGQEEFNIDSAHTTYEESAQEVMQIQGWCSEEGNPELLSRVLTLMRSIQESYSMLVSVMSWSGHTGPVTMSAEDMVLRFSRAPDAKEVPIQIVYKYVLSWTRRFQLRHRGEHVYKQCRASNGLPTHAWIKAVSVGGFDMSTLEKMVAAITVKARNASVWSTNITVPARSVIDKLKTCLEPEFPYLKTTRSWIAFADGLYNVYAESFVRYEDLAACGVPADLAVCSYHKVPFGQAYYRNAARQGLPRHPLVELKTPLLDKIFDTQKLCGHTKFWFMAMLGRLLYFANVLDSWQICLMLKGTAGTGKSTLIEFVLSIYEPQDTVNINNDAQSGFGLMGLNDEIYVWTVGELKQDFNVDQAQFQSLVSQQRMTINVKHQAPFEGVVRAPGMLAGNTTLPTKWQDNAGSMCRRIFGIKFANKPSASEGDLLEKLRTIEMPFILRKINWCYRHAVVLLDGKDVWQCGLLPNHILQENDRLYTSMNTLRGFLQSGLVKINADYWCPLSSFQKGYYAFCKDNLRPAQQWSDELCNVPFKAEGITVRSASFIWDEDPRVDGKVIMGACIQAEKDKQKTIEGEENPQITDVLQEDIDYLALDQQ